MLVLAGNNPIGNVLHVVSGPETEMFTDIHGAKIVEITSALAAMDPSARIFLSLTRCKSEPAAEARFKAADINYISSFAGKTTMASDVPPVQAKKVPTKKPTKAAAVAQKCEYCKREAELLPVPGVKICTICAQIEIGRAKAVAEVPNKDTEPDEQASL